MAVDRIPHWSTPDLADDHGDRVRAVELQMRSYGLRSKFCGAIATIKCFEDNSLVREAVHSPGHGRVLVIDGGGSMRRALMGDLLVKAAIDQGWAGAIINGLIRDVEIIDQLDFGIRCLGSIPLKTDKLGQGQAAIDVYFGNVRFSESGYAYSDQNGILVSEAELHKPISSQSI